MDYSLIVGICDLDQPQAETVDAAPAAAANGGEDEEDGGDTEENGFDEDMADACGAVPTPPDSPQPNSALPFTGELDEQLEKYAIKSDPSGRMMLLDICVLFLSSSL